MKIVCISDTHGLHNNLKLPEGDLLIHCGDFLNWGTSKELKKFIKWFSSQNFKYKVCVAGNHDFVCERYGYAKIHEMFFDKSVHYLENTGVEIEGLKIWGSPFTPRFMNWAFMEDRDKIHKVWERIPDDVDFLITHGPAWGVLDTTDPYEQSQLRFLGCQSLLHAIRKTKPKYHAFGHIHGSHGVKESVPALPIFINCSVLDENYDLVYKPIELEV